MQIVMFHTDAVYGSRSLPAYLDYALKQVRMFFDGDIYFITDSNSPLFDKYGVDVYLKKDFHSEKIKEFESLWNWKCDHFWTVTATRLIYIENFIKQLGLKDIYHFENDVLLFHDPEDNHKIFRKLYKNISITIGEPDMCMTGFMFIPGWEKLSVITQYFIDLLKKYGIDKLKQRYKTSMINEMTLMRAYGKDTGNLDYLPILPYGEYSQNFDKLKSIYDPSSWGQFVGGTNSREGPGIPGTTRRTAYIGQELINNPDYSVVWKEDRMSRRIPYFKYGDKTVRINNLHIHSKNLHKYMS